MVELQRRLVATERQRRAAQEEEARLNLAKVEYGKKLAIRDQQREILNEIKTAIEDRRILVEDPETPKVMKMGLAPEPLEMSSPRWEFYFPGGTLLGLLLGVGFAFLVELLNDLLRTPRDVTRHLNVPLLGVIPDATEEFQVVPVHVDRALEMVARYEITDCVSIIGLLLAKKHFIRKSVS